MLNMHIFDISHHVCQSYLSLLISTAVKPVNSAIKLISISFVNIPRAISMAFAFSPVDLPFWVHRYKGTKRAIGIKKIIIYVHEVLTYLEDKYIDRALPG